MLLAGSILQPTAATASISQHATNCYVCDPEPFHGNLNKCCGFLLRCWLVCQQKAHSFPNDFLKVSHLPNLACYEARHWPGQFPQPPESEALRRAVTKPEAVFGYPDPKPWLIQRPRTVCWMSNWVHRQAAPWILYRIPSPSPYPFTQVNRRTIPVTLIMSGNHYMQLSFLVISAPKNTFGTGLPLVTPPQPLNWLGTGQSGELELPLSLIMSKIPIDSWVISGSSLCTNYGTHQWLISG